MHSAHPWDKDGEDRRPFAERNDGRSPAQHFTGLLAVLALNWPRKGSHIHKSPQKMAPSEKPCASMIFYFLYNYQKFRYGLLL